MFAIVSHHRFATGFYGIVTLRNIFLFFLSFFASALEGAQHSAAATLGVAYLVGGCRSVLHRQVTLTAVSTARKARSQR